MTSSKLSQTIKVSSDHKTGQDQAKTSQTTVTNQQQSGNITIAHILANDNVISAWLTARGNQNPEIFIALADELAAAEKEGLLKTTNLVLNLQDDLPKKIAELAKENRHLKSLSLTDELTSLYNYRFFARQIEIEMTRTRRTGQPCALMMIDLDNFKLLNDTLGHGEGNNFLVRVSDIIREKVRPTDIECRYGGDEFAIIMPATFYFDALRIAKRLQEALCAITRKDAIAVSASIGLAEYDPFSKLNAGEFIAMADRALYKAKQSGKNRICYEAEPGKEQDMGAVTPDEKKALLKKDD